MPKSVADWALILCGPILRLVEKNSVTVWVALKERRLVSLLVYPITDHFNGHGGAMNRPMPIVGGFKQTIKMGERLHVACITANPSGYYPENPNLLSGHLYCYDLQITEPDAPPPSDPYHNNLLDQGLLYSNPPQRPVPLSYEEGFLPRFALPPEEISDLRIFHGS